MTNLPVPVLPTEVPGGYITSSVFNTVGVAGLGFALNVPVFSGYQAASQSVTNTTPTAVTLDSENADTYGGHSTSTNPSRYIGQAPGYYACVGTSVFASNSVGGRISFIYKNGVIVPGAFGSVGAASNLYAGATAFGIPYLNGTTDYVELWTYQSSGSGISTTVTGGQSSSLLIWWLHA